MEVIKRSNRKKKKELFLSIGIFVLLQIIFVLIDGTRFEPNINDSNHIGARIGRFIIYSKLFTEWITPYSYPYFNMFTTLYVAVLFIQIIYILYSIVK